VAGNAADRRGASRAGLLGGAGRPGKFDSEIDSEIAKGKFTLAELEEEEQSLERLRRWHRELATRDVFGAPNAAEGGQQLKHCTERLAEYTDRVFQAVHQM
jgi:hypothetical protein